MIRVLIVLDGSDVDARIVDLAATLLAGRALELTLLHVVPVPPSDDQGSASTAVLEGFVDAEACGDEVAPLVERLHASFDDAREDRGAAPRLVPRHLIHGDDLAGAIECCGIAQERHDSLALLAAHARRLRERGFEAAVIVRDSAIGDPATTIWETARHQGADLVIVGGHGLSRERHVVEDPGWMAHAPCPVLVVPGRDDAAPGAERRADGCGPAALA